jgi:hypothetical protein
MRTVWHCLHISRGDIDPAFWSLERSFLFTLESWVTIPDIFPPAQLMRNTISGARLHLHSISLVCGFFALTPITRTLHTTTLMLLWITLLKMWGFKNSDNSQCGLLCYTMFSGRCTTVSEEQAASIFQTNHLNRLHIWRSVKQIDLQLKYDSQSYIQLHLYNTITNSSWTPQMDPTHLTMKHFLAGHFFWLGLLTQNLK